MGHYGRLAIMTALSFIAMYLLMYAMVDTFGDVFANINQVYMAGLMAAPMLLIELALMRSMYPNNAANAAIAGAAVIAMAGFFLMIRQQTVVADRQFLRSMIPHHASAILMCQRAPIRDPEIQRLCKDIIAGQQSEIDQMKAKLGQLEKSRG